ncbi:MAG: hypothetical protein IT510_16070 [Sulfuritalea sp.]|nr:hypothetical protein [Sulfuritalea sp.]
MKKPDAKPARKPAPKKSGCAPVPSRVTPEFLATLKPEVQEFYKLGRKLKNVIA